MIIRDMIKLVQDEEHDIQERLLVLITLIAFIALFIVFLGGIFVGENIGGQIVVGAALIAFGLIIYFSLKKNAFRLGAILCSFIIVFIIMPLTFFTSGGVLGGAPAWILLSAVFITMTTEGRIRVFLLGSELVVTVMCYVIGYLHPEKIDAHTVETGYKDQLLSVVVVSAMVCLMVGYSIKVYRRANLKGEFQRKEIDELNRAQNQFFSSMSHEIRTPINSIIGLNEMILREDISKEVEEDALNIQSSSRLLLNIINDLLDMSKIESGRMEVRPVAYDVRTLLSDVVGTITVRIREKGLDFKIYVDPSLPAELYGDELKLKQILINILSNAAKYTKEGNVSFSVQGRKQENNNIILTFTVSDTGIGIRKDSIPNLFSAFKRVDVEKNRYIEGTGLGLAIVKQLLDLMGGSVKVNSVYMQGSTFIVDIPQGIVSEENIGSISFENSTINKRQDYRTLFTAKGAKVLAVDDNTVNLLVIKKLLRNTGLVIDTAESGEEALQKTLAGRYDVILMDHLMPEMDGIECFHRIREQEGGLCKEAMVCMLTANAGSDNIALYNKEGFDGYLLKPVTGELLEKEIMRLLPRELIVLPDNPDSTPDQGEFLKRDTDRKLNVMITTDSICDLPASMIKKKLISVMPYHIMTKKGIFLDGIEAESRFLNSYVEDKELWIRSGAPESSEYEKFFSEQLKKANNIIHISASSGISRGFSHASEASGAFNNVSVFDSSHISSGMGIIVMEAARLAKEGKSVEDILKELTEIKSRIHTSFIVEDTLYLSRTGRINPLLTRLINAFMLHPMPILVLRKAKMTLGGICFGSRENAFKKYISQTLNTTSPVDTKLLFITSAGIPSSELKQIEKEVREMIKFDKVVFQKASLATSVNCGPGCFGLLFMTVA